MIHCSAVHSVLGPAIALVMEGASQADNDVEGHSGTIYGEKVQLWKLLWSWPRRLLL